jgi:glycosyltransferase involved in cell wall biosynthesis
LGELFSLPGSLLYHRVFRAPQIRSEVDVIVPCYNVQPYLPRALHSVFSQTFTDYRLCAVDDGSTDGTAEILQRYAHSCTFASQPHRGAAAARNRAIRMSASPFIAFLDADDEWLPGKLQRQVDVLEKNPSLGLVCSLCFFGHDQQRHPGTSESSAIARSGRLFRQLLLDCFVFTPTVVVRRECLKEVGLFNESLAVSEDFNLWLRIASRWDISFLPEVLAVTHTRPGSLSSATSLFQRARDGVAALKHVRSSCPTLSGNDSRALRRVLAERHYTYGSVLLSSSIETASRRQFTSAIKLQPTHWKAIAKLALSLLPASAREFLCGLRPRYSPGSLPPNTTMRPTQNDTAADLRQQRYQRPCDLCVSRNKAGSK